MNPSFRRTGENNQYIRMIANYGIMPAIIVAIIIGWLIKEYPTPTVEQGIMISSVTELWQVTPFVVGFPSIGLIITSIPTAILAYVIAYAYVNVIANMLLASIIRSATAQIAMMSKTMVPEMEKAGYSCKFSAATTASAGLLGPIIPPSMLVIIYGVSSGTSIGDIFLAGIIPGIIFTISFIILIGWIGRKETWPTEERLSIKAILGGFVKAMPAIAVPVIIILGIITGAFTPTEFAAIASVVALFVGFLFTKN